MMTAAAAASVCESTSAARNATVISLSLARIHEMTVVALAIAAAVADIDSDDEEGLASGIPRTRKVARVRRFRLRR